MYQKNTDYNEIITNKDDIYNLSVRKKAAYLCSKIIAVLKCLNTEYGRLNDGQTDIFIENNKQIELILDNILKTLNTKENKHAPLVKQREDTRLYICRLLTEIAESIISLSNIISIRHIERELIYASELVLKQLIYILPYKLE